MKGYRLLASLAPFLLPGAGCRDGDAVTVYTSVDMAYSQPVLEAFETATGIRVEAAYDVEAQKTTGLYRRLLDEKERPRADVFWNSEVARTVELASRGVLAPYRTPRAAELPPALHGTDGLWHGFALRARVLIYHRERLGDRPPPESIRDLASSRFRGDAAIARPLFGTTATHAGALAAVLGREEMAEYFRSLLANDVRVVEGNAVVRRLVAAGEVTLGLTDTDDAHEAVLRGDPVVLVYPDQEAPWPGRSGPLGTFVIPNTVALVAGGPRPELGKRLIDFLLGADVESRLASSGAAVIPVHRGLEPHATLGLPEDLMEMEVDYDRVAAGLESSREVLQELFQR